MWDRPFTHLEGIILDPTGIGSTETRDKTISAGVIRLDKDEVEDVARRPRTYPHPRPATHTFSASAWLRVNPGGNVQRAITKARDLGFEVTK
jgi:hypothetical protein